MMEELILKYKSEPTETYYGNEIIRFYVVHSENNKTYYLKHNRRKYPIPEKEFTTLLETISQLKFNEILPDNIAGCDGAFESIEISKGFNTIKFIWWCDSAGEQWNSLYRLRDKIIKLKEQYVSSF